MLSSRVLMKKDFFFLKRNLSSVEQNNALRPFLFLVHPDLFGNFPDMCKTNLDSLQVLNHHLSTFEEPRVTTRSGKTSVTFFARSAGTTMDHDSVRNIKVKLENTVRKTVLSALSSADLPTGYVDKIPVSLKDMKPQQEWWEVAFESRAEVDMDLIRRHGEYLIRRGGVGHEVAQGLPGVPAEVVVGRQLG